MLDGAEVLTKEEIQNSRRHARARPTASPAPATPAARQPTMAENSQEAANRASRGRGPGRPFPPGVSGNAGGRPKGIPTFSILRMIAEALTDEATRKEAILRLRDSVKQRKTVVQTLEFAARVNREIGLGSEASV
jgi:hypothetical protein